MHAVATPPPVNLMALTASEKRELYRALAEAFSVAAAISWDETELHASAPHDESWADHEAFFTIHYSERVELVDDADRSTLLRHLGELRGLYHLVYFHRAAVAATIVESHPEVLLPDGVGDSREVIAAVALRYRVVLA